MPKRVTTKDYVNKCKAQGLDLPIEDYINNSTKIKHRCKQGHTYYQTPNVHLQGHGCSICSGKKHKTPEEYYQECKDSKLDLPIENYINNHTKIKHKCNKGHIYKQLPGSHLRGDGCPYCAKNKKKTQEHYYNECKSKELDLPIENYINNYTKIKHKCNKGHIYEQRPNDHLKGHGCPKCKNIKLSISKKKTPEEYYNECKSKGYDLPMEDYKGNKIKIKHRCSKGHIYEQTPVMHSGKQQQGCPICNESHGEIFIRNYLDKNNIEYIPQKRFHDLKDKTYLSYDFYLPEYNTLIEYQGIQHYESINFKGNGKYSNLEKQQKHDKLKREYAKDNGYKLLELKYTLGTQELVDKYLNRRISD